MAEPAAGRPPAVRGKNGSDSSNATWAELRRLIIGPEQEQIGRIERRLSDPDLQAEDISRVLPHARIRKSLDQVIRAILKRDPELVAEVVRPIIFLSVRKAVTDALREFTESLNQIAEKSVSLRALRWRFEAFRTGRKFSDIVLSRSLLYSVREVFLIHGRTGVMLQQVSKEAVAKDADMIASMFSAVQEFMRDSFVATENRELETIDVGSFKLWITHGPNVMLAGAIGGAAPAELKRIFQDAVDEIENKFAFALQSFQGEVSAFDATRPILERCLLGESGPQPRKSFVPSLVAGLAAAGLLAWGIFTVVNQRRWSQFVESLRAEPGIVVISAEKQGSQYVISGLRDELARDPVPLAARAGIPAGAVKFRLEPYQSLDHRFVTARTFTAEKFAIEKSVIRFAQGKSELSPAELDHIDNVVERMHALVAAAGALRRPVRISIIGHTDEMGSDDTNQRLSQERARKVSSALVAAGIDPAALNPIGVSMSQPLRSGSSERDRDFNRSVSFQIVPAR